MNKFNNLPPFKAFVLQNFPFIEEDFDALTYYEILCKIIGYLNDISKTTNEISKQVEILTNWFNNLDVQEEIDNKLDAMAESGELAEIINQEIFGELNSELNKAKYSGSYYNGKNFVVFGDSYSQPNIGNSCDEQWVKRVETATGMTRFNFAIAGAGFGRTNNTFLTQLATAQSTMTSEQKNNTSIVIVYGGYNDILNDVDGTLILTNCATLLSGINSTFPNAKIILAPFNWGYGQLSRTNNSTIETLINQMSRNSSSLPVVVLKLARYWLLGIYSYYQNSGHPSQLGYNLIASYMLGAIYGNSEHVEISGTVSPIHGGSGAIANYSFKDGFINFVFGAKFDEELEDYSSQQLNLPPLLTPESDIPIPLYSGDEYCGLLVLQNDGKANFKHLTLDANTWVLANITFSPQAWAVYS